MHGRFLAISFLGAALVAAPSHARAEEDAVEFFHDITVSPDTPVQDAVCFFCSVHADGEVNGDIVVFFGNVRLDGQARGDIVNFFGSTSATGESSIGGDVVNFFGTVHLGDNVKVGGDLVEMFGAVHAPDSVSVKHDRVTISPIVFFAPLLVIFLIVYLIVHEVRTRRMRIAAYPMPPMPPPQAPPQR